MGQEFMQRNGQDQIITDLSNYKYSLKQKFSYLEANIDYFYWYINLQRAMMRNQWQENFLILHH